MWEHIGNKRSIWTLPLYWTTTVGMANGNFLQTFCIKTHCCSLKQLKPWVKSHTVPHHMHVSILDHFQHLNFDLSISLKLNCDGRIWLLIYYFLLVFNSNIWLNSAPLRDISLRNQSDLDIDLSGSLRSVKYNRINGLPHICFPINV